MAKSDEYQKIREAVAEERQRLERLLEASKGDGSGEKADADLVAKHLNELDVILAERGLDMIEHVDLTKLDRWLTRASDEIRGKKD